MWTFSTSSSPHIINFKFWSISLSSSSSSLPRLKGLVRDRGEGGVGGKKSTIATQCIRALMMKTQQSTHMPLWLVCRQIKYTLQITSSFALEIIFKHYYINIKKHISSQLMNVWFISGKTENQPFVQISRFKKSGHLLIKQASNKNNKNGRLIHVFW